MTYYCSLIFAYRRKNSHFKVKLKGQYLGFPDKCLPVLLKKKNKDGGTDVLNLLGEDL